MRLSDKANIEGDDMKKEWLLCPFCGSKTRLRIRNDTVLENFPLFCPKCKHETLIAVRQLNLFIVQEPDAKRKNSVVIGSVFAFSVIPSVEEKENATGRWFNKKANKKVLKFILVSCLDFCYH